MMAQKNFWQQLKERWSGKREPQADTPRDAKAKMEPLSTIDMLFPPKPTSSFVPKIEVPARQQTPLPHIFPQSSLFFSGWGYDERKGNNRYFREQGKKIVIKQADGKAFVLRRLSGHVVYRSLEDQDERAALLVSNAVHNTWPYQLEPVPDLDFIQSVTQEPSGRCLLYVADFMKPEQCAYLLLQPDGSGVAMDEHQSMMARFHWPQSFPYTMQQILAVDVEELRPFCKRLFDTQINPHSANPYLDPDTLVSVPHQFLSGSEEELRHLTVAIAQTEPGLFDNSLEPVTITYRAQTSRKRAGMTRAQQGKTRLTLGRLTSLCDLALRLNTFVGVEWKASDPTPNRLGHFEKQIHKVCVTAHPPSAHERAESLLLLADWLEGKVREEKRLRLLGIEK